MTLLRTLLLAAVVSAGLTSVPAMGEPPRESKRAFDATREGRAMPLPQLERKVLPFMGDADYIGPEMNGETYRFKFIQNGRVIWVDVDGQGRVVRRSNPSGK